MNKLVKIIEIPAKPKEYFPVQKLKVAAYCRVSKNTEEQLNSLDIQKQHYESLITSNPLWENAGIFADIASGSNMKARSDFQKMLKACRKGKINLILTKSVSRFGRNTLDSLKTLDKLRELGVDVWFELENIRLLSEASRLRLDLLSGFAQEESESRSKNIKWGLKQSFQSPKSKRSNTVCYGYVHDQHGYLIIHEKQAAVVQMIFRLYLNGYSLNRITKELKALAIPSPAGKEAWSSQTLNRMLSNEKHAGNVLLQKTYVKDYISGKQLKNSGQRDQYYIINHHAAIISQAEFDEVQQEKKQRSNISNTEQGQQIRSSTRYSSDSISGLLICAECGNSYRRITRNISEEKEIVWRCASRVEYGKKYCKSSPTVSQQQLENVLFKTFGVFPPDQDLLRKVVRQITVISDALHVDLAEMDDITRSTFLRRQEYQLCQAYLGGDTRALEYLFEWNYPLLRRHVFSISRRSFLKEEDKEDVIQNAALKSIQCIAFYNGKYRFWAWLKKIAYHEFCRAIKNARRLSCEASIEYFEWKRYEGRDDFAEWESEQTVEFLLSTVNEGQLQIIVEKIFDGKTLVEIGRETNICRSTVDARYRSGLKQMRKVYIQGFSAAYHNK
ncbi:MAG: sigma-70 family RNA polymerase sigma factor [Candidatus Pelethousia sp.]|nr:sigma-70 family RNA polymerase sigma factor [Candidatus Pelethousia sp.]